MNETWKNVNMCAVYVYTLAGAKVRSLVLCSRCNERAKRSERIPAVILTHSSTATSRKTPIFANYLILDIKEKKHMPLPHPLTGYQAACLSCVQPPLQLTQRPMGTTMFINKLPDPDFLHHPGYKGINGEYLVPTGLSQMSLIR